MRKINALLLSLFSFNCLFGLDIPYELNEIDRLEKQARAQYIAVWFGLGITSLIAAKFLGDHAEVLEKELKDKWFWNPQTQQEEIPAEVDQTTGYLYYWGGKTATVTGCLSLIWGIKQAIYVGGLRALIKLKETLIEKQRQEDESEHQRQHQQQENDPGFRRWKQRNPFGTYEDYALQEMLNKAAEALDPGFKQWRQSNPGGSYYEYQNRGTGGGSPQSRSTPPQPPLRSYYEILGLKPTATEDQIKTAYKNLARNNHPSTSKSAKNLDPAERSKREAAFKEISDAWDTLKNAQLKSVYDSGWSYTNEDQRRKNVTLAIQEQTRKQQVEAEVEFKRKHGRS